MADSWFVYQFADKMSPYFCGTPITPNVVTFTHGVLVCGFGMCV